jgi:hypothetical protein
MGPKRQSPLAALDSSMNTSCMGAWCDDIPKSPFSPSKKKLYSPLLHLDGTGAQPRNPENTSHEHTSTKRRKRPDPFVDPPKRQNSHPGPGYPRQDTNDSSNSTPLQRWMSETAVNEPWRAAWRTSDDDMLCHSDTSVISSSATDYEGALSDTRATSSSSTHSEPQPRDGDSISILSVHAIVTVSEHVSSFERSFSNSQMTGCTRLA